MHAQTLPGGLLAVPKGTCSHQDFSGTAVAVQGASAPPGPILNAWGPGGGQEGLSPVLVWIAQSQEAEAEEARPGQAAAGGLAEDGSSGQTVFT